VARALLRLRRESGMTLHQLSAAANCTVAILDRYEQGASHPRLNTLKRLVGAMGLCMSDLYRAQRRGENEEGDAADGTLPPDTRKPDSAMSASNAPNAALRLAQECGKAVAHCCLAFMELQSGRQSHRGDPVRSQPLAAHGNHRA
jgi:transcriptional regulator with XRE-family HTH domain